MPVLSWRRLSFAALLLTLPAIALGQTTDPFSVRRVAEDIQNETPTAARTHALLLGQRDAYQTLMQRLTASSDWPRIPKLDDAALEDLVLDVGIDQERILPARYIVSISVRFKADMVRKLLKNAGIAYAEWRGRPVVIVPLWQTDNAVLLNDGPNPWREIWRNGAAQGLVPVLPVPNEVADFAGNAALAAAGNDVLADLSAHFNSPDVLIVVAAGGKGENGLPKLDLTLTGQGPIAGPLSGQRGYGGDAGESQEQLLLRAAQDLARTIDDGWKSANLLQYDKSGSLMVLAPLGGFEEWLVIRDKLTRATAVRSYDIAALSKSEAALALHFVGDQGQLESLLMQNGLVLTNEDGHWVLRNVAAKGH